MKYERDIDGGWHAMERQHRPNSCGPASVKIVQKLVNDADLGEQYVRMQIAAFEGNADGNIGQGGLLVEGVRNFAAAGTWNVRAGLDALRPAVSYATYSSGDLAGGTVQAIAAGNASSSPILVQTSRRKPAITEVRWVGGGAHWVVVAGPLSHGRLLVLDPWYGVQYVTVTGGILQPYAPRNPVTRVVEATANWAPNVVIVT
ncbi:hypothetical protein [Mangrovicoccus sp. HB161399]|uniref:hypothetical protein n=1 Tax=Mangrovicoccus sp. HB161399 TaxID=2720392 RepID=UPI0015531C9C|nr:hypothetical protein [Mangrovicoccus sp. HB161399]